MCVPERDEKKNAKSEKNVPENFLQKTINSPRI